MKINTIIFLLVNLILYNTTTNAQSFRQQFDNLDQQQHFQGGAYSWFSNLGSRLKDYESKTMNAYLNMYEASNDMKYLNEFLIHSKRVMDRRDDFISNTSPIFDFPYSGAINCQFFSTFPYTFSFNKTNINSSINAWSRVDIDTPQCVVTIAPHFMETGQITFPMARFILMIYQNPNLYNLPLPNEVNSNITPLNYNGSTITTLGQYAQWLKARVYESINWQINTYNGFLNTPYKHFESPINFLSGGWGSINQQSDMGRSMILMYYISNLDGNVNNTYRDIIEDIATMLYHDLHTNSPTPSPSTVGNGLPWWDWCHAYDCSGGISEDISHAWLDEEFAELYMQYFHPVSGYGRFDITDMQKFANGESNVVIAQPRQTRMNVHGSNSNCDQMCDGAPTTHQYATSFYAFLCQYNADVYQQVADFFLPGNPYEANAAEETLLAYSYLAKYEHVFNSLAINYNTGAAENRVGCTAGTFATGQSNTFATVRNMDGAVEIYSIANSHTFNQVASVVNHGVGWSGITAADLDGDGLDEIFALHNTDNAIYIYQQQGNTLTQTKAFTLIGSQYVGIASGIFNGAKTVVAISSNGYISTLTHGIGNYALHGNYAVPVQGATGIAIGKFNNIGNDEIATINNNNGYVEIWDYNTANHSFTNVYQFTAAAGTYNQWNGLCAGDFDGDGQDEITAHRNYDGDFYIYKVKGGALVNDEKESFPIDQQNGVMCSINLPDLAPNTALLTLRNYDGNMVAFSMEGKCQNLHVSNQTISESTSLDNIYTPVYNNYPVDYHVHNILTAGNNYTIQSPAKVDFTAGKLVDLKPGFSAQAGSNFHAWIEPALACTDPNLRMSGNNQSQQHQSLTNMQQIVESNQTLLHQPKTDVLPTQNQSLNISLNLFPNPFENSSELKFYLPKNENNVKISIYNLMGQKVREIETGKNLQMGTYTYTINREQLSSGIYQLQLKTESGIINKQIVIQ